MYTGKPQKLGIIAGGGEIPRMLADACEKTGIDVFLVGIEGNVDTGLLGGRIDLLAKITQAGKIVDVLKKNGVRELVLIGSIKRPEFMSMAKADAFTLKFLARLGMKALGDSDLLDAVRKGLEKEGFTIRGVHEFMPDMLAPSGLIGKCEPTGREHDDIIIATEASKALGRLDIGQAVVAFNGRILGVEGVEGTNELIRRCASYRDTEKGGVLVKSRKPGQDKDIDLPTIGVDTVLECVEAGFSGIAVHAGNSLIVDIKKVIELTDNNGIFLVGVNV